MIMAMRMKMLMVWRGSSLPVSTPAHDHGDADEDVDGAAHRFLFPPPLMIMAMRMKMLMVSK